MTRGERRGSPAWSPTIPSVAFRVSQRTLRQLDWPRIVARLASHLATPRARARCAPGEDEAVAEGALAPDLFAGDEDEARALLVATSEARALLDAGELPPLGGVPDLEPVLRRLAAGGVLSVRELLDVGRALEALHATAGFLAARREQAPGLAERAEQIVPQLELAEEIEWALDPEGVVRDAASPALAEARARTRQLSAEVRRRVEGFLQDPDVAASLSDAFVTVRGDRFVLPVRADGRGRVRGIVHDVSGSGTTVFVEPAAVVDLNNRLKQAELEVERETLRVLRQLSERAARALPELDAGLEHLAALDAAFARGRLSREMEAVEPEVGRAGRFYLPQLRHPLLDPAQVVPNDLRLDEELAVLVLSGPNAGGKTVAMKALALAALFVRAGLHVPAAPGARVDLASAVLADIGDEQDLRADLSTFSAHMAALGRILESAGPGSLVVVDEIGVGTDPGEGAAIAQAALETLAETGARVVVTTHYGLLKELAEVSSRFENASVELDPETLEPTYRLRPGTAGASSATAVAARMGVPRPVLDRARSLLEREDRQLDRILSELATSRATLERERAEAERARAEGEEARARYRARLERLEERRENLFREMRADLDRAFGEAHARVAAVIRDLQRGDVSARDAARARERLLALEARRPAAEAAVAPAPAAEATPEPRTPPPDWGRARPGDPVRVQGLGAAVLLEPPDHRGRVAVRLGGARLVVAAERVRAGEAAPRRPRSPRVRVHAADAPATPPGGGGGSERIDLHGLRVAEALDRLPVALDRALRRGCDRLEIVHGRGTGALREAVRSYLVDSPFANAFAPGTPEEGGEGVTVVFLD